MNLKVHNTNWRIKWLLYTRILSKLRAMPKKPVEIIFVEKIESYRQHSLWYGGGTVEIKYQGYTFSIDAIGDIRALLCEDDIELAYVKDKCNNSNFYCQMLSYLKSDKELLQALDGKHELYKLSLEDSNWWECSVTDEKGVWHDLAWCLDSDYLLDAVVEVLANMDSVIDEMRKTKKIRIYQVDLERDEHHIAFMQYDFIQKKGFAEPPASIYNMVFDGGIGTDNLEKIFSIFNVNHPTGYQGRSLSMSDVVELYDDESSEFYYCDSFGYEPVSFDRTQVQSARAAGTQINQGV